MQKPMVPEHLASSTTLPIQHLAYTARMAFVVLNPEAKICRLCGERRFLFRSEIGPCCFRCPSCELEDILAHLRGEVGAHTSAQFLRNMQASPWQRFMF